MAETLLRKEIPVYSEKYDIHVLIPNPYDKGDRVRLIGTDLVGEVSVSQEEWKKYVEKALSPDSKEDWVDASITVRYADDGYEHDHVNTIYLEKVNED